MSGLSREILKWIQTLELSYSVKNVRRDFSNGFLIAEILSRYYPQEIQMHSFDTGAALIKKLDNWAQLEKFFKSKSVGISREMMDAVIHCKPGGAIPLIEALYTFLTGKSIRQAKPPSQVNTEYVPPFARPTASKLIKDNIPDSEDHLTLDLQQSQQKMQAIVDRHNEELRKEKAMDPARFTIRKRSLNKSLTKSDVSRPPPQLKEIKLKEIDAGDSLPKIQRSLQHTNSSGPKPTQIVSLNRRGNNSESEALSHDNSTQIMSKPILFDMNYIVEQAIHSNKKASSNSDSIYNKLSDMLHSLDPVTNKPMDIAVSFMRMLDDIPADIAHEVFSDINDKIPVYSRTMLYKPKEFASFIAIIANGLHSHEDSFGFLATVELLNILGDRLVQKDQNTTRNLFDDFAFPILAPLIRAYPSKRAHFMNILYSYCANDVTVHIQMIKSLQEQLADSTAFIYCLTSLIHLEEVFNDDLLDLYTYYCVMGISAQSPALRAASLSMLPVVINQNANQVVQMLGRLSALVDDEWWEVLAQMLVVCSSLLEHLNPHTNQEESDRVCAIISNIVLKQHHPSLQRIALSYLAPQLQHHPALSPMYTSLLLSLPESMRLNLIGPQSQVEQIKVRSSAKYEIYSLPTVWHPLGIARSIANFVKENQLDNLEQDHFDLLEAAICTSQQQQQQQQKQTDGHGGVSNGRHSNNRHHTYFNDEELSQWAMDVFEPLKNYLYVALCDEQTCDVAAAILLRLFIELPVETTLKGCVETLFHTLEMIYMPEVNLATTTGTGGLSPVPTSPQPILVRCQEVAPSLLIELYNLGEPFASQMAALAELIAQNTRMINNSSLSRLSNRPGPSSGGSRGAGMSPLMLFLQHVQQQQSAHQQYS